jgi:polyisoprenoid-binding protein YceI
MGRTLIPLMSLCVVALTFNAVADEPRWTVEAKMSRIGFTGRQMGAPSKGEFKRFSADIRFDPANLAASAVEVTIDTASADTGNRDIDTELKRPNWFEVDRFPQARFVTTSLRAKGGNGYEAAARLTIRDVTQDVVLPFVLDISPDGSDPTQLLAKASGELTISRSHFGIGRAEWRDTKIVADEISIRIEVVARRKR